MRKIPQQLLESPVQGVGLTPGKLIDQLAGPPLLLTFLRHFG